EEGAYEVIGYNRKNCPAVSNVFRVELPDLPVLEVVSRLIGCTAGQPVDLASQIPGYDIALFDYRLSGMGLTYYNDELRSIGTGTYVLSVKLKNLDCYSAPVPLEVFIQEIALAADFDFGVQGSGVKDDAGGGIVPDDVIQFQDLSDERITEWSWDFGDGLTSSAQNPTHAVV